VYNAGTYTTLDFPESDAVETAAYAINNAGEIVGTFQTPSNVPDVPTINGFLFNISTGVFTQISAPGLDINNFGFIATGVGFILPDGQIVPITDPGAQSVSFGGINDAFQM